MAAARAKQESHRDPFSALALGGDYATGLDTINIVGK